MPVPLRQTLILVIFFASGASALVYEVVWARQLALVFGATAYAITTVLATFMGGLALGSYAIGRFIDRRERSLRDYALLELGIGVYGLCVPWLFDALRHPYVLLYQLDLSQPVMVAARALLAGLVLLPPTMLMGATFPVLTRLIVSLRRDVGRSTGTLYFANTLGGLAGCFVAGFYLIETFGLLGSTRIAALTNFGLAAATLAIGWRAFGPETGADAAAPARAEVSPLGVRVALIAVGISGFAALAYEVIWTRALLRYLFNSTYAFTTMLGAFLAGIAIGSWLYQWLPGRKRHPLLLFAAIEAAVGLGFAISSATFANLPALSELLTGGSAISSFREATLGMFARASLILLPPAICLGAAIPAAAEICTRRADRVGGSIARVYATNTLGSVLGSIAATFVLIPLFGMHGSLLVLIGLNAAMAASLAAVAPMAPRARWAALAACGALVLAAVAWVPPDLFQRSFAPAGSRLLYYEEGATDTVGVGEHAGHRTILYDDQRGTASTSSYAGNFFLGHLPMLLHPGEPQLALHICFGVGNSLSAMASHDSLERVDSVELSPNVTGAAGFFWTNDRVLENPKVRSIADDGRNFVMASRERYDVIALEPPEPFTAGVINLFSREFYQDALERLADDGVMLQWIPVGLAPLDEERQLFRAFSDVFPHVTAWQQLNQHGPILLVGTRQPLEIDLQRLKRKMSAKRVRQDLALGGIRDVYRLLATFVYDADGFAAFVDGVEPVTDDRTTLDFSIPRYIGSGFGLGWGVQAVADGRTPITAIVGRKEFYDSEKRSVMPYLTNLGDTTTAQVAERIRRHLEPGFGPTPSLVGRRGWARMRRNL